MQALVSEHTGGAALIAALSHALGDFTGAGREQEDDVTLVALSRAAGDESFVAAPAAATSSDVPAESPGWHTLG